MDGPVSATVHHEYSLTHRHTLETRWFLKPLSWDSHIVKGALYHHTFRIPHLVTSIRSTAHVKCSQLLQPNASRHTHTKVPNTCRRLRISGAENLAAVETHTKMTVTMASMMLMHFPSNTLASVLSNCKTCCCCCCCNSNLPIRVWQASSASCRKTELYYTIIPGTSNRIKGYNRRYNRCLHWIYEGNWILWKLST